MKLHTLPTLNANLILIQLVQVNVEGEVPDAGVGMTLPALKLL
jgi:hypothetical protein